MKAKDYAIAAGLALLAAFIWFRDTGWMSSSDDTLPALVSIPVFAWLATPWAWRDDTTPVSTSLVTTGVLLFLAGLVTNLTLLLGIAWTVLLWSWLSVRVDGSMLPRLRKLLVLPMMAFPWVTLDAQPVGWWFRLSGATVAESLFSLGGMQVLREGTLLTLNGMRISVEPACSGLNTLQSMLIAGSMVAFLTLGNSSRFWPNLLWLPVMAWLANTIRIVAICAAGLLVDQEFAMGPFHDYGGWAILFLMFCMCWLIFSSQEETPKAGEEGNA